MRVLSKADVEAILATLSPEELLASQAQVFRAFSAQSAIGSASSSKASDLPVHAAGVVDAVQQPLRIATFSPQGRTLYMPSYVSGLGTGCKILTRTADGMKTSMLLLAPDGELEGVVDCKPLTGVRNAAGELTLSQ